MNKENSRKFRWRFQGDTKKNVTGTKMSCINSKYATLGVLSYEILYVECGGDKQHLKVPLNPALGNFAYLFILFFLCSTSFNLCVFSCEQGRILVHGLIAGFHCFRVINPFMFNANDNLLWHKLRNHSF